MTDIEGNISEISTVSCLSMSIIKRLTDLLNWKRKVRYSKQNVTDIKLSVPNIAQKC
jgi:hypothetical protein